MTTTISKILIISLLISANSFVHSQKFSGGFITGINTSQVDGDTQQGFRKLSFFAGTFVGYPLSRKVAISAEFYYIGKGAVKQNEADNGTKIQEFKTVFHYIELPVLFNYTILPKLTLSAGVAPAYLISEKLYTGTAEVDKNLYKMNTFDISPIAVMDFKILKNISLSLRYSHALTTNRADDENWYNRSLTFGLRYKFKEE
jgi:hypothetical protein